MTVKLNKNKDFFELDVCFKKIKKNTYFVEHLIQCLKGKKSNEIVEMTIKQLQEIIEKEKNNIKKKEENGKL